MLFLLTLTKLFQKKKPQTFFRHGCWAVCKEISPCKRIPYIIGMDELLLQPDSWALKENEDQRQSLQKQHLSSYQFLSI